MIDNIEKYAELKFGSDKEAIADFIEGFAAHVKEANFLEDMVAIARKQAQEELAPVRNQQKAESFDKQWNALYTAQLAKAE